MLPYRALAPDGAIRDQCGFTQTVHRGGMSRRDNSSVRRNDHDGHLVPQGHKPGRRSPPGGCLVPKGHKLGRTVLTGGFQKAPSGAKPHLLPKLSLSRFRKLMASLRCPISMFGLPSRSAMVRDTLRMLAEAQETYFDSTIFLPEEIFQIFTDIFSLLLSFRPSGTETTL